MSSSAGPPSSCCAATVGEYIEGVVLKELYAVQLERLPFLASSGGGDFGGGGGARPTRGGQAGDLTTSAESASFAPDDGTSAECIGGGVGGAEGGAEVRHTSSSSTAAAATSFDPRQVAEAFERLGAGLAADLLETAGGWVPAAAEVTPETLLPDLDQFPAVAQDVEGLTAQQRKLLFETTEMLLDIFNDPGMDLPGLAMPMLPRTSIASIAAQVAHMLDRVALFLGHHSSSGAPAMMLETADLDLSTLERLCPASSRPAGGGQDQQNTKANLVDELQRCRQRIFNLEKELAKQARNLEAEAACWKREQERSTGRLMGVNQVLEAKLKHQTQENKRFREQVQDSERRLSHEQWRLAEKDERISRLEAELARHVRLQSDMLVREKEYGRRIIQVRLQEFESCRRTDEKMRRLSSILQQDQQEGSPDLAEEQSADRGIDDLVARTLKRLEREFDEIFEVRQEKFKKVAEEAEAALERREERFYDVCEEMSAEVLGPQATSLRPKGRRRPPGQRRDTKDAQVQTESRSVDFGGTALPPAHAPTCPPLSARVGARRSMGAVPLVSRLETGPLPSPEPSPFSVGRRKSIPSKLVADATPLLDVSWLVRRDQVTRRDDKRLSTD